VALTALWMLEGLKNIGGSFSKMIAKVLSSQMDNNVLTYVDDIIVRSTKKQDHISDLQETFANVRRVGLKLNIDKCVFGVKKASSLIALCQQRE
jgi:endonuclease III